MDDMDQDGMDMDQGYEMGDGQEMLDMEEGQMMDDDGYGGEDESFNFEENPEYAHMTPLDRMRKIRREILRTINDMREAHGVPAIYVDLNANRAANDYA